MKKSIVSIFVLVIASLLAVSCKAQAPAMDAKAEWNQDTPTIDVQGIGEVHLSPDLAYVTLGVRTESVEAGTAISDNNRLSDAIMAALEANGVEANDIGTSSFNVYWREDWSAEATEAQKIYVVENMVDVTIRSIDDLGTLLDAALDAGANSVYGVRFDVQDKSEALEEARKLAVANAQEQAEQLTMAAGVELGDLINISSWSNPSVIEPMYAYGMGGGGAMMDSASSVPVAGGELVVQVQVSMVYGIEK